MNPDQQFDDQNLSRVEAMLLDHEVARGYFQGELYDRNNNRLKSITLDCQDGNVHYLSETTVGRLFMIPDHSAVWALMRNEHADAPAGLEIQSISPLLPEGTTNSVIAFRDKTGQAIWVNALHIHRFMLSNNVAKRLATVSFGLMTITAYRLGFERISLFAAGKGPLKPEDADALIGFSVWPKFGFDAPISAAEMNRTPLAALRNARTVQEVLAVSPQWWARHGTGRIMDFDLTTRSRSWSILLNYLYEVLQEKRS